MRGGVYGHSLLATALLLSGAYAGSAQTVADQSSAITHELMSPFCPGLLLADCRSEGARELREEISGRLESGETPSEIESDLIARFGSRIRTVPEFQGIGLLVWIGPALIGIGSLFVVTVAIRTVTARSPSQSERETDVLLGESPAILERLRDELRDLD